MPVPPPGQPVLQLRIMLEEVHPPVWRRLPVPGSVLAAANALDPEDLHEAGEGGIRQVGVVRVAIGDTTDRNVVCSTTRADVAGSDGLSQVDQWQKVVAIVATDVDDCGLNTSGRGKLSLRFLLRQGPRLRGD